MTRASLLLLILFALPAAAKVGAVEGSVLVRKDGAPKEDHSGVVVYLEGAPAKDRGAAKRAHEIVQRDRQFQPRVTVVQKGDVVAFPNADLIVHNVFSRSPAAEFDLGEYKQGVSRSVRFRKAGSVDIYCNKHPWMVAHVKVLDTPHYALTNAAGEFRIEGVPPGTYTLVVWQPSGEELRSRVSVAPGSVATPPTQVLTEQVRRPHLNKYGAPYDEYR